MSSELCQLTTIFLFSFVPVFQLSTDGSFISNDVCLLPSTLFLINIPPIVQRGACKDKPSPICGGFRLKVLQGTHSNTELSFWSPQIRISVMERMVSTRRFRLWSVTVVFLVKTWYMYLKGDRQRHVKVFSRQTLMSIYFTKYGRNIKQHWIYRRDDNLRTYRQYHRKLSPKM